MGARGPPPKPSALRLLRNPDAKRKLNDREPQPKKKAPKIPPWLGEPEKREWRRLSKELLALGVLTVIDGDALGRYCVMLVEWVELGKDVWAKGRTQVSENGYEQERPQYSAWKKLAIDLNKMGAEFGLSPSSRTRVRVEQPKKKGGDWESL